MTQSDILLKHLSTVFDPELGANIVELGMVKDVQHVDKTVTIKLALTIADCPMRNQIETEINRKLKLLENVEIVEIAITAMDQKDRTAVMEKAREKARENAQPTNVDPRTRVIAIGSAKGGVGYAKASGNYAAQFYPTKIARDEGYQQIIWTDSNKHNLIEEAGTMNLFFRINNTLITSPTSDSILDGITRKSIIEIAKNMGIDVDERPISVNELVDSHKTGALKEIFGTGTAVTILPINGFGFRDNKYKLENITSSYSNLLKKTLHEIQFGETSNFSDWQFKVN